MKKVLLNVVAAVLTIVGLGGIATMSPAYAAIQCIDKDGKLVTADDDMSNCAGFDAESGNTTDLMGTLTTVINVVIAVVGFVAVIMIILGGISFITSQGDTSKVTKARNTILYGVVGLVVSLLAFAIVNFVLTNIF